MSRGNSKDFASLVFHYDDYTLEHYKNFYSEDSAFCRGHSVSNFITDYRRAIEHYYKACGCKIISTNNNWWDDHFYVYHTPPTTAVDPVEWFDNEYKDGIYWSNNKIGMLYMWSICTTICITIVIFKHFFS